MYWAILFFWILYALIIGFIGKPRKIGFGYAFLLAILLSPVIGLIITLLSKKREKKEETELVFKNNQVEL